jgi:hypothetical protein
MDSTLFFKDNNINSIYKDKSGLYVIEQPLFSEKLGYAVYKVGYARNSLYIRIADYRTAYGLIPFKIHALYCVPNGVKNKRVNYARWQELVVQETLRNHNKGTVAREWFKDIDMIISVFLSLRQKHIEEISSSIKWNFWIPKKWTLRDSGVSIVKLVDENTVKTVFQGIDFEGGAQTRQMLENTYENSFEKDELRIAKTSRKKVT